MGISEGYFGKINTLAVCGTWDDDYKGASMTSSTCSNINDLSCLSNISNSFKSSLENLYLHNNKITNIEFLHGFTGVKKLVLNRNDLRTLKGLKHCTEVEDLHIGGNNSFGIDDTTESSNSENSLYDLQFCPHLTGIFDDSITPVVRSTRLIYLSSCVNLRRFDLNGINYSVEDILDLKKLLKNCVVCCLGSSFDYLLLDESSNTMYLPDSSIETSFLLSFKDSSSLTQVNLENCKILENGVRISVDRENEVLTEFLSSLRNLRKLDICGTRLKTLDFIVNKETQRVNTPNLVVIHLLNTSIADLTNLKYINLEGLAINNDDIDLSTIEKWIGSCSDKGRFTHGFVGLYLGTINLLKQLNNLKNLENYYISCENWQYNFGNDDLDLRGMSGLKTFYLKNAKFKSLKLPSQLENLSIIDSGVFPDMSNLSNLKSVCFTKGGDGYDIWNDTNVVSSLESMTWSDVQVESLELQGLSEIVSMGNILNKFNIKDLTITNCKNIYNLNGIETMVNLETISLKDNSNLISLNGLSSLSGLRKLTMNNCSVMDLSELENMTSLDYIDLKNNLFQGNNNLKILAGLREENFNLELYLKDCSNILDWSLLEKYDGWWHSDEKAGYN